VELTEAGKVFLAGVEEMPLIAARGEPGSLRVGFASTATLNVVVPSAIHTFSPRLSGNPMLQLDARPRSFTAKRIDLFEFVVARNLQISNLTRVVFAESHETQAPIVVLSA
jgi:hypothetical protein